MTNTKISIIIPMYNSESTINRCIDSIYNQKGKFVFEIIVIDDGSIDNSAEIIERYIQKKNNIKLIKQENQKQSIARNKGLDIATGKYIIFLDSDDYLKDNFFLKLVEPLKESKFKLSLGGITKVFEVKNVDEFESSLKKSKNQYTLISNYFSRSKEMDVGLWNKVFLKSIIEEQNIRFKNSNFFEDNLFVLEYILHIKPENIFYTSDIVYFLQKKTGSTTMEYRKEIDTLAYNYLKYVKKIMADVSLEVNLFELMSRTYLHVVHHHIKYDVQWDKKKQMNILNNIKINKLIFSKLSIKYKLSIATAKLFPNIYRYLYAKR